MTQPPNPTDPELELARQYGSLRGSLDGQLAVLNRIYADAYLKAHHGEFQAAGLCTCPDPEPDPGAPALVGHKAISDALSGFMSELSRIAGLLQPKPRQDTAVELVQPVVAPELAREVDDILAGLGEQARAKLATGGIVSPPGKAPDWAPHCSYGCDNEAQSPHCPLHSPNSAVRQSQ